MGIICWDKPKKIRSTEKHNAMHSSDSGVDGTYVPNMSEKDRRKWKGKLTQTTTSPQVEIRKDTFVIIVGLDGYNYKQYRRIPITGYGINTKDFNIHIAAAGPIQLSFNEWNEFIMAVAEAREFLQRLKQDQELRKLISKSGHSFNKKKICVRCGMSSQYVKAFGSPCAISVKEKK